MGFFSPHSWWPIYTAAAFASPAIGLIFGPWLFIIGFVLVLITSRASCSSTTWASTARRRRRCRRSTRWASQRPARTSSSAASPVVPRPVLPWGKPAGGVSGAVQARCRRGWRAGDQVVVRALGPAGLARHDLIGRRGGSPATTAGSGWCAHAGATRGGEQMPLATCSLLWRTPSGTSSSTRPRSLPSNTRTHRPPRRPARSPAARAGPAGPVARCRLRPAHRAEAPDSSSTRCAGLWARATAPAAVSSASPP